MNESLASSIFLNAFTIGAAAIHCFVLAWSLRWCVNGLAVANRQLLWGLGAVFAFAAYSGYSFGHAFERNFFVALMDEAVNHSIFSMTLRIIPNMILFVLIDRLGRAIKRAELGIY